MISIYTTCQNVDEAKKLGKLVVEKKMASCVNIWPIESIYWWQGAVKEEQEAGLYIKTLENKLQAVEDLISSNHAYSVPMIATSNIYRINRPYKEYMAQVIE